MRRAIAATSDAISHRLTPTSTALGQAFGVEEWYVELFAEEVVRGGPAFAVSLVLSAIEPALRAAAELGSWQLISPGNAVGRVAVVSGLHEVQDKVKFLIQLFLRHMHPNSSLWHRATLESMPVTVH